MARLRARGLTNSPVLYKVHRVARLVHTERVVPLDQHLWLELLHQSLDEDVITLLEHGHLVRARDRVRDRGRVRC